MPRRGDVARADLEFVITYVRTEKKKRPGRTIQELRQEAVKVRAEQRAKSGSTIYRNLKFAIGLDKKWYADNLDELLGSL